MAGKHTRPGGDNVMIHYERFTLEVRNSEQSRSQLAGGMEQHVSVTDAGQVRQAARASRSSLTGISVQPRRRQAYCCDREDGVPQLLPSAPTRIAHHKRVIMREPEILQEDTSSHNTPGKKRNKILLKQPSRPKSASTVRQSVSKRKDTTRVKRNDSLRLGLKLIKQEFSAGINGKQISQLFSDTFASELVQMGVSLPVGHGTINWQHAEYLNGKGVQTSWQRVDAAQPAVVDAMRARIRAAIL